MKDIIILGIETSCDETSVAVVKNGKEVLSNIISSQIDIHKLYGGVVPEIASRKHIEVIDKVFDEAILKANIKLKDVSAIAVTYGPGLVGALLVGINYAKGLSLGLDIPLIGINHIEGHIAANYISNKSLEPPFLTLIISGGHTNLVLVEDRTKFKIYGKTHDDACGETFDKVARVLGLSYPGGPKLEEKARKGTYTYQFPRGNIKGEPYDFTFSGLKSSVINTINSLKQKNMLDENEISNISFSFQKSVIDTLTEKSINLARELGINKFSICGGVSANKKIREEFIKVCEKNNIEFYCPELILSTDNAGMIAQAGYYRYNNGDFCDLSLNAEPNLEF